MESGRPRGLLAGLFAGSTGSHGRRVATGSAQDVAHDTLGAVGISVPRSTEDCPEGTSYRNHGDYVSAVEAAGGDVRAAAHSDCGKPVHSRGGRGAARGRVSHRARRPLPMPIRAPVRPPWAGTHLDADAKKAARAEREATCGPDDDPNDAEVEADDPEKEEPSLQERGTTTTVPGGGGGDETTTTVPAQTTTARDHPAPRTPRPSPPRPRQHTVVHAHDVG